MKLEPAVGLSLSIGASALWAQSTIGESLAAEPARVQVETTFEEYLHNLSHVRRCSSSRDRISTLSPLVVPSLKLAFCYIPKVACTDFKDLFNNLNHQPRIHEGFGHDYLTSSRREMKIGRQQITRESGWKFAVFTRDPALRYLSAFGSACVSTDRFGHFEHAFSCCGPLVKDNAMSPSELVKRFEARVMSDLQEGLVKGDHHWVEQTQVLQQCGWWKFRPKRLDFHGHLSGDVNAQVKAMLNVVNHTDDALVDRLFPQKSVSGHKSPIHQLAPERFYRNATVLKAVMKLYEEDYRKIPGIGDSFTEPRLSELSQAPRLDEEDHRNTAGIAESLTLPRLREPPRAHIQ